MPQWKKEEIRELLHERIQIEVKRQQKFKQKVSQYDIANVMADFVIALMSDARRRELGRLEQWVKVEQEKGVEVSAKNILSYVQRRKWEVQVMARTLFNYAEQKERER